MSRSLHIRPELRVQILDTAQELFRLSSELSIRSHDPVVVSSHSYLIAHWLVSGQEPPRSCSSNTLADEIERTIDLLSQTELVPSLPDGYLGVAWMINSASALGLNGSEIITNDMVDPALRNDLPALHANGYYGFLFGVTGALWFELHRRGGGRSSVVADRIEMLSTMSQSIESGVQWWTPPHQARWGMEGGYCDLGFAHGHAGVTAALSTAYKLLPSVKTRSLLKHTLAGYDAMLCRYPSDLIPHATVPGKKPPRHAWCYGVPGIAVAMFAAARALNDHERATAWAERLAVALAADSLYAGVDCAGFCHGAAGLAQIAMQFTDELGQSATNLVSRWLEQVVNLVIDDAYSPAENPLLDGAVGISLVLLSAVSNHCSNWSTILGMPQVEQAVRQS